ncbi:hypothetical protein PUNSTDRAFT_54827 [Punctularia strigosozonata HHB-11173 SS5]|uniref:uncharacterized protein n=1 Tax=Punctularia strigosozonata (strain HHB-11173) TaxID=741275 RepID=UPI000441644C|nr:uncharacterized protein PUNSTDRAFT_54827 [Punctularia strigosozonata HHB-11173 SS5]EIN05418.1 hypothetical protein PUNSTDRAFT_54827 [Punctularia strigosozonata HHB-11173 SS5]
MQVLLAFVVSGILATVVKADTWGAAYSLGPTAKTSSIIEASTVLIPGTPPPDNEDYLFLWPGISNATSGLIQAGADSAKNMQAYCGARNNQWCSAASYFGYINGVLSQWSGPYVPVEPTDQIHIHYKLRSDKITWDQTVTINGTVTSTQVSYDGPLIQGGWGTGTECQEKCTGARSTQYYLNTSIVLSASDYTFPKTLGMGAGVVATDLYTPDGGITWKVDSISIPPMTIDASGNPI